MTRHLACLLSIFAVAACSPDKGEQSVDEPSATLQPASVELVGVDGKALGTVGIAQDGNGTTLDLRVTGGLEEGMHGVHLHETGQCDLPDFSTAGGHWNPEGKEHGRDNPDGAHVGDLANLAIDGEGRGRSTILVENVLLEGGLYPMSDEDGTALVVHAGPDDYVTNPSGDSGARVACAVLTNG